jgi:hypothetical protein
MASNPPIVLQVVNKLSEVIQWVSVDDEYPDDQMTVLIHMPDCSDPTWIAYHDGGDWVFDNGSKCTQRVTHWAEMPEGPK